MTTDTTVTGTQDSGVAGVDEGDAGTGAPPSIPQETVDAARSQGWVPKEEFRGPADKWVDADEFNARATQINGIVNANNRRLKADLADANARALQAQEDATRAVEYVRRSERARYDDQIAQLRSEKAAAITDGDGAKVLEIEQRMEKIPKPEATPAKPADPAPGQIVIPDAVRSAAESFAARNAWFGDGAGADPVKTELAMAVAKTIRAENPNAVQSPEYFAEIERRLNSRYPTVFGKKTPPAMSESGGAPGGGTKPSGTKKGYADLPPDAKAVADRYESSYDLKKEEYAKQYWAEQEQQA